MAIPSCKKYIEHTTKCKESIKKWKTKVASLDHEYIVCLEVGIDNPTSNPHQFFFMSNLGWSKPNLIYVHSKFKDLKYLEFDGTNFQTM
jgi:hypothetical protein